MAYEPTGRLADGAAAGRGGEAALPGQIGRAHWGARILQPTWRRLPLVAGGQTGLVRAAGESRAKGPGARLVPTMV